MERRARRCTELFESVETQIERESTWQGGRIKRWRREDEEEKGGGGGGGLRLQRGMVNAIAGAGLAGNIRAAINLIEPSYSFFSDIECSLREHRDAIAVFVAVIRWTQSSLRHLTSRNRCERSKRITSRICDVTCPREKSPSVLASELFTPKWRMRGKVNRFLDKYRIVATIPRRGSSILATVRSRAIR